MHFLLLLLLRTSLSIDVQVLDNGDPIELVTKKLKELMGESSEEKVYSEGVVASENPECSRMGVSILKRGGNAVDASVTVGLCIGLINSFSSGIGGGGFMLVYSDDVETSIDFREVAPKRLTEESFGDNYENTQVSGLAVGVPGEIRGYVSVHDRFGKLPWKEILQPVIELAEQGFIVSHELARRLNKFKEHISSDKGLRETYFHDGQLVSEGETIKRRNLAETLRIIAQKKDKGFYEGPVAERIVQIVKERGGLMELDDLKNYEVKYRDVISQTFKNMRVHTIDLPACGPLLIQALNVLEHLEEGLSNNDIAHSFVEVLKHIFASRSELEDPIGDSEKKIRDFSKKIMSKEYADKINKRILKDRTFDPKYYQPQEEESTEDHGTTHFNVVDKNGLAVATTSTINLEFGSKIMDPVTGIILNNEVDDFSIPARKLNYFGVPVSSHNRIRKGARPLSSAAPAVFTQNGRLKLVIGGAGGTRILSAVLQTIMNIFQFGKGLMEAIADPRIHHQLRPNTVMVEYNVDPAVRAELEKRHHHVEVSEMNTYFTSVNAIMVTENGYVTYSDFRKGGMSDGY